MGPLCEQLHSLLLLSLALRHSRDRSTMPNHPNYMVYYSLFIVIATENDISSAQDSEASDFYFSLKKKSYLNFTKRKSDENFVALHKAEKTE